MWFNFTVGNVRSEQVQFLLMSILICRVVKLKFSTVRGSLYYLYQMKFNNPYFVLQRVIFNIVNFSKTKSLYRDGMSPLVKSTSRPNWYTDIQYSVPCHTVILSSSRSP